MPLKVFTILALFALLGSNAQAMSIKKFLGIRNTGERQERLIKKIDTAQAAHDELNRIREARARGEVSGSELRRAYDRVDRTSQDVRSAIRDVERKTSLSDVHQERLADLRGSLEQTRAERKEAGKAIDITYQQELTLKKIGRSIPEKIEGKKQAEEAFQTTVASKRQSGESLNISDPVKVVRKPSVQVKEIETVLKDAQNDLNTAEKAAEKARNAHMAYEDKLRKDYPAESEILNKRDFEKARIAEITKNLEGDSAQTRRKLQSEYNQAIASGDANAASTLKARLEAADKKILAQKEEVVNRQRELDKYDKIIAQVIKPDIIEKFDAAEGLKAKRLAAEEQKTKVGLEVNTIRAALQEAKSPTKPSTPERSAIAPQIAVTEENKPSETVKPLPPIPSSPVIAPPPQEESEKKSTVEWKKIPAPVNIQREIDIKTLKDKQASLPEDSIIERAKIDKEIAAKKFESSVAKGFEAAQKGDIIPYAKALSNEQKQLRKEVDAEDVIRKEQNRKLLDKEPEAKQPTVGEKLDSTKKTAGTDNQPEASTSPTPVRVNDRTGVPLPKQSDEEKKLTQLKTEQPTLIKILPTNKPSSNVAIAQDPEAPKPTVSGASGPERRASAQIETTSPPPLPPEITKVPSTSSEAPKPEPISGALAQQIQAGTKLKKVDPVALELEKKAAQEKNESLEATTRKALELRRDVIAPNTKKSKDEKKKAEAEEAAFWATPTASPAS